MLTWIGAGLEVLGLLGAARGLRDTWKQFNPGVSLRRAMWDETRALVSRRKRRNVAVMVGTASTIGAVMSAHATVGFPPSATADQKLDFLKELVDNANRAAGEAAGHAARVEQSLERLSERVDHSIESLRSELGQQLRTATLDGLPLAMVGVLVTAAGAVLQAFG